MHVMHNKKYTGLNEILCSVNNENLSETLFPYDGAVRYMFKDFFFNLRIFLDTNATFFFLVSPSSKQFFEAQLHV